VKRTEGGRKPGPQCKQTGVNVKEIKTNQPHQEGGEGTKRKRPRLKKQSTIPQRGKKTRRGMKRYWDQKTDDKKRFNLTTGKVLVWTDLSSQTRDDRRSETLFVKFNVPGKD